MLKSLLENVEKKYLYIGGGVIVFFLIIAIIGACNSTGNGGGLVSSNTSFEKIKTKMVDAAKKYYEKNPRLEPKEDSRNNLRVGVLVGEGLIQPLNEYVKEGINCDGRVIVSKIDGVLYYVPLLDCGTDFREIPLYDVVNRANKTVNEGTGLYDLFDRKIFRGEVDNNYVKIENSLWRIMDIYSDKTVRIIYEKTLDNKVPNELRKTFKWDDRYNIDDDKNSGINDFEVSRLNENLSLMFSEKNIVPDYLIPKLNKKYLCIDKITLTIDKKDDTDCETLSNSQYSLATLTANDFIDASIDEECTQTNSRSCTNYNYLTKFDTTYWTLSASLDNTHQAYFVSNSGVALLDARNMHKIRPTLYLNDTVITDEGDGTIDNPYILK